MGFKIEYQDSWLTPELDEILMYIIGGDWGKEPTFNDEDYQDVLCIRGSEIRNWQRNKGNTASLRKIAKSSLINRQLIEGDILLEISGGGPDQPVGRTVLVDKQSLLFQPTIPKVCTNFMRLMRFPKSLDSKFINYYFDFFYASGEIVNYQGGSNNLRNLKFAEFSKIRIPLPPFKEQQRIVSKIEELFSDLDNGIDNLKLAQTQLKVYRQALLKSAFEGKLTEQWRKENNPEPAEKLLERIKEERKKRYEQEVKDWKEAVKVWEKNGKKEQKPLRPKQNRVIGKIIESEIAQLPKIPIGWKYTKLGNLGSLERGKSKHRPRNDSRLFGGDYPFIQTGEVRNSNIVIREFEKTYSEFGLQQSKLWKKGTLCITIAANIAETAFLGFDACFPDSVVGYLPENNTSDKYIFHFIEFSKKRIEEFAPATAQKNINLNILDNIYTPICSINEQLQIVNHLDSIFSIVDNLESTIIQSFKHSEYLRQSILKKAFEGKLVEQDPRDEPASELLKRIQAEKKKYLENQKKTKKTRPIKSKKMSKELSIEQVLLSSDKPMLAKDVWQQSKHKDSIEDFYAELKKIQNNIKEVKKGTESLLSLAK